ncbi:MAG: copper amine oxidase N-terminal domain-containing protein [Brevibacillus sp.]|nr:copper amine oxidase N-terminal domain-containing protein [Brevibacillus sp.]
MRKLVSSFIAVILVIAASMTASVDAATNNQEVRVQVEGQFIDFPDAKPFIDPKTGRTLVPLRFVSEQLGVKVEWDGANKVVKMEIEDPNGKYRLDLPIGKTVIDLKHITFKFESPAVIIDDRTYVPLRFISEVFGAEIEWDGVNRVVKIEVNEYPHKLSSRFLHPKHELTQPAVDAFYNSLKIEGDKVIGKVPTIPKGYTYYLKYKDDKDRAKDFLNLEEKYKPGQSFSIPVSANGGHIDFAIAKGTVEIINGCSVDIPTFTVRWRAER